MPPASRGAALLAESRAARNRSGASSATAPLGARAAAGLVVAFGAGAAGAITPPPIGQTISRDGFEGGAPACVAAQAGIVPIDVRSIVVHPVFLHNGAPFGGDPLESAQFFLQPAGGKKFLLGTTSEPPTDVRVLPGVYDVIYDWRAGNTVPRNKSARVAQGIVLDADATLTLDMPSFLAEGAATLNGAPFPPFAQG